MVKVQVKQGLLEGQQLDLVTGDGYYYSFKGIPYAEPPVGPLRFKVGNSVSIKYRLSNVHFIYKTLTWFIYVTINVSILDATCNNLLMIIQFVKQIFNMKRTF